MKLKEPVIREAIKVRAPFKWDVISTIELKYKQCDIDKSFRRVLEERHSERNFTKVGIEEVGKLFYLVNRTKSQWTNEYSQPVEKRNYPSPGALHSIYCLISSINDDGWYLYNSRNNSFDLLKIDTPELACFKKNCFKMLAEIKSGYLVWYLCDTNKLSSKYKNITGLAFRESGAISAIHSLTAEAIGLSFCMLGIHGNDAAQSISSECELLGVGAAIVGGRLGI
ncbi:hypothetical protein [Kangiella sp. TOML190]|uniref:hypothetical protein n=1 Tax=Kangiella sp. TOML190 TaxID=2931351 RepID=UPI00203B00AC|nr:hypothetical protein [Kangiella sp. TOML190]